MNKNILFLVGMISISALGMDEPQKDQRCLWPPRDLRQHVILSLYEFTCERKYDEFDKQCSVLACVNRELSREVPYEKVRLTWDSELYRSPLFLIIERRAKNIRRDQYLCVAERFLRQDQADPNYMWRYDFQTPLQKAVEYLDKPIVKLFLEHGGDPFKVTVHWIPQGPLLYLNAFHYAKKDYTEASQLYVICDGWLKDIWDKVQQEKSQKTNTSDVVPALHRVLRSLGEGGSFSDVGLPQSEDRAEAEDKSNISEK